MSQKRKVHVYIKLIHFFHALLLFAYSALIVLVLLNWYELQAMTSWNYNCNSIERYVLPQNTNSSFSSVLKCLILRGRQSWIRLKRAYVYLLIRQNMLAENSTRDWKKGEWDNFYHQSKEVSQFSVVFLKLFLKNNWDYWQAPMKVYYHQNCSSQSYDSIFFIAGFLKAKKSEWCVEGMHLKK